MRSHLAVRLLASLRPALRAGAWLAALGVGSAGAQGVVVDGLVWDSVARAPLRGAAVQLARATDPSAPLVARAVSDSAGRFVLAGIAPARYLVTFFHPDLEVLGIEPPVHAVEVRGTTARLELAVPGPERLYASLCGRPDTTSVGAVLGALRDAETGAPAAGAVALRWAELVLDVAGLRHRTRHERVAVDPLTGRFLVCGVPAREELTMQGARGGDTTGVVPVEAPVHGVARRDLWVGGAATSTVRVVGRVRSSTGLPLAGADARVLGASPSARATSGEDGTFALAAPGGTRTVEVRALGYAPERQVVDLVAGAEPRLELALTSLKSILDTVRVTASRAAYRNYGPGFETRRRSTFGRFLDAAQIEKIAPLYVTDLLKRLPGIRLERDSTGLGIAQTRGGDSAVCLPVVFLDDVRFLRMDLRDLDALLRPAEIGRVEVYTGDHGTSEYKMLDDCAAVVLWTRRAPTRPRSRP